MTQRPHCLQADACAAKGEGHCRMCWGKALKALSVADPEIAERRRAGAAAAMRRFNAKVWASPEGRARRCEQARANAVLQRPESRAKAHTPEAIAKRIQTRIDRNGGDVRAIYLPWCPREFFDLNAELRRKGILLADRKRIIAEEARRRGPAAEARRQIEDFNRKQRERVERERAQAY